MRHYEALYIVRPDLKDDEVQTIADQVESMVKDAGGTIVRSEQWGKRKLAYEVQKYTEGYYILLRFDSEPEFIRRLETHFRLSEQIIRFLVTYFDEKMLRLEAEQQERRAAELQAGRDRDRDRDDDLDRPSRRGAGARRRSRDDDEDEDDED